jgi:ABC-type branched-subunit amino acid transport system ATPase component
MSSYLQFAGVTKSFGGVEVVAQPFSLDVARNEFVVFLGPSGCGKTTSCWRGSPSAHRTGGAAWCSSPIPRSPG